MNAAARRNILTGRFGDLGFIAVVIAAYLSALTALSYVGRFFTWQTIVTLVAASVAYLIVGVAGFGYCRRSGSPRSALIYFAVQLPLVATIVYLARRGGLLWLCMLPLASQSVVLLPRRWVWVVCALLLLITAAPLGLGPRGSWTAAAVVGVVFSAGLVFVVVFTQIAVNERQARGEVERLAAELGEANRKLREYAAQVEELATAKERNRLAREIHDSLGHYLTVINVQIEAARAVMESDRPRSLDALRKAQSLAQEGLADVRRSVAALRTPPTESHPLPEAVATLAEECRAAGIATDLVVTGDARPLAPQAELTLYRAAQEGLTNVRKHAQASHAKLTLDYSGSRTVRLEVQDDGVGATETNGGFGLLGVRERTQLLGGEFHVRTAPGQGFILEVELPG